MLFNSENCVYCGECANTLDHVVPKSYTNNFSFCKEFVIPCCNNCNSLLGNIFLHTISKRAEYLEMKIKKRYKKELNFPDWSKEELDEVSPNMSNSIRLALVKRENLKSRIEHLSLVKNLNLTIKDVWG